MAHVQTAVFRLGNDDLTLEALGEVARGRATVEIGSEARSLMEASRAVVDEVVAGGDAAPAVYGVNTGFGALAEVRISAAQVKQLQKKDFPPVAGLPEDPNSKAMVPPDPNLFSESRQFNRLRSKFGE